MACDEAADAVCPARRVLRRWAWVLDPAFAGMTSGWGLRWAGFGPAAFVRALRMRKGAPTFQPVVPARKRENGSSPVQPVVPARKRRTAASVSFRRTGEGRYPVRREFGCTLDGGKATNGSTTRPCPQRTLVHIQAPI